MKDKATALLNQGLELFNDERYGEAEIVLQEALQLLESSAEQLLIAQVADLLGQCFVAQEKYDEAEPLYLVASSIRSRLLPRSHELVVSTLSHLANLYFVQKKWSNAEKAYTDLDERYVSMLGLQHIQVALNQRTLSIIYGHQQNSAQAEGALRKALVIFSKNFPLDHPEVIDTIVRLAQTCQQRQGYEEAIFLWRQALGYSKKNPEEQHVKSSFMLSSLIDCFDAINDPEQAVQYRSELLKEDEVETSQLEALQTMFALAESHQQDGSLEEAKRLLQRMLNLVTAATSDDADGSIRILKMLGDISIQEGNFYKAEEYFRKILEARESELGPGHAEVIAYVKKLASLYYKLNQHAKAEPLWQRLLTNLKQEGAYPSEICAALHNIAVCQSAQGKFPEAEQTWEELLAQRQSLLSPHNPEIANCHYQLGDTKQRQGKFDQAENHLLKAIDMHTRVLGAEHPLVERSLVAYAKLLSDTNRESAAQNLRRLMIDTLAF